MSYRIHEHKKPMPQRSAADIATPIKLYAHNGTTANFAFPCWYQEIHPPVPARGHDRHLHDHQGWPSWQHPDHICQLWVPEKKVCIRGIKECRRHCKHYIDYSRVLPIHLLSEYEGYTDAYVQWVGEHEGIEATAYIDPVDDWVVRVLVDCQDPYALEEPQKYKFTVFVGAKDDNDKYVKRDIVALSELVILPSAY